VAARARLMQALPAGGAMTAIAATEAEITAALAGTSGVSIAAVNGPSSVVISGDHDAVEQVAAMFAAQDRRVKPLRVSHAFHSHRMDPVLAELGEVAARLEHQVPRLPWACAASGELVAAPEPGYWVRQAREPVRFADAVAALAARGVSVFIEIGPDGTLSAMGPAALPGEQDSDDSAVFIPVLRPGQPGPAAIINALARAYVHGTTVDWAALLRGGQRVDLPTYAFQRQRYWPQGRQLLVPAGGDGADAPADARFWAAVEGGDVAALAQLVPVDGRRPLSEMLPVLASWRRQEQDRSVTGNWRYRISWLPVTEPATALLAGTWLVVAPAGEAAELAQGCVRALAGRGAQVVLAEVSPAGLDRAGLAAQISQALAGDAAAGTAGLPPACGVLSLLALAGATTAGGLAATQALVQALGDAAVAAPLWVLTCGAVATGPGDVLASPGPGPVWGLGRVAALEHPDRWGGLIDLPTAWDERVAARLCAVLAGCGEDQVAIRGAGIVARRLVRAPQPRTNGPAWTPRGTVLITGGTGAIGGHMGRWLAGRGAPRVVLAGRSGPGAPQVAELAAQLAASGTAVDVVVCDVARRAAVAGLLAWIAVSGPPLTAVLHAAGRAQDAALEHSTTAELAEVMAAKASGAAYLDELTADLDLEQFVLFSSIAATWGSGLQPGYAAANAFLDGLAETRRARGLAATSVAWGPWGGGGMTDAESADQLQRRGLRLMEPELLVRALAEALDGAETLVTVADVDWARFAPPFTLRRPSPLIADLPEVRAAAEGAGEDGPAAPGSTALAQQLAGMPRAEQERMLVNLVRAEAAAVLGHASPEAVEAGRAFRDLGFDSLTAVELRDRLNAVTGLRLPATLVFDYPTPDVLADYLLAAEFGAREPRLPLVDELDKLEALLSGITPDDITRELIAGRLQEVLAKWSISVQPASRSVAQKIDSATDDEIFTFIHKELGRS
jgi:acyl transferase domain-containing protein